MGRVVCCYVDQKRDQSLMTGTQTPPRPWSHVSLLTLSRSLFSGFFQMLVLKQQRGPSLSVEPHSCPSHRVPVVSCPCCRAGTPPGNTGTATRTALGLVAARTRRTPSPYLCRPGDKTTSRFLWGIPKIPTQELIPQRYICSPRQPPAV